MLAVEALQRAGVRITEKELDELLVQVVSAMLPTPLPRNPRMELTEADAAALERGGLALEPLDDLGPDDPIVKTVATYASLLASSLTVSQVAPILGVSTGRVRQELYAGTIYGIGPRRLALPICWSVPSRMPGSCEPERALMQCHRSSAPAQ